MQKSLTDPKKAMIIYIILGLILGATIGVYHYADQILIDAFVPRPSAILNHHHHFFNYFCFSSMLFCMFYGLTYDEKKK